MVVEKASTMHGKLVGADFDGVWDSLPNIRMMAKVIITGRSYEEAVATFAEIKHAQFIGGIRCPIYFNPVKKGVPNLDNISSWKAEMIKRLGLTDYYEDDPAQVNNLMVMCPGVEIHLVNSKDAMGN